MGADKALLAFAGQTMLQHALKITAAVADDVRIVGPKERYAGFGDVVEDIYPGCGPLAGIHAALAASPSDLNLMLSVDMPLMTAEFLRWLVGHAEMRQEFIVVPSALGGSQPLCAVYHRMVRVAAEAALQTGEYKVGLLFDKVRTRVITEQEIVAAGFSPDIFRNVNTVAEYEALVRAQ